MVEGTRVISEIVVNVFPNKRSKGLFTVKEVQKIIEYLGKRRRCT